MNNFDDVSIRMPLGSAPLSGLHDHVAARICQEEEEVGEEAKVRATASNTNCWGRAKNMRKENVVSDTKEKNSKL